MVTISIEPKKRERTQSGSLILHRRHNPATKFYCSDFE